MAGSRSMNRVSTRTSRAHSAGRRVITRETSKRDTAPSVIGGLADRTSSLPAWSLGSMSIPENVRCPRDAHFIPPFSKLLCPCFSADIESPYQTTHWYDTAMGYSACPWQASLGGTPHQSWMMKRVEEVGTHCCTTQGCGFIHRGSVQHFLALIFRTEACS